MSMTLLPPHREFVLYKGHWVQLLPTYRSREDGREHLGPVPAKTCHCCGKSSAFRMSKFMFT